MESSHSQQHEKRKTVSMGFLRDPKQEIELCDLYSRLLDSYREKDNLPKHIEMFTYTSEDSQLIMYLFDQESYQKFKDHLANIPQTIPVNLSYNGSVSKNSMTGKVLVVKSAVNGKIQEVPIISDWYYLNQMICSTIPQYFFPCQFVYEAPGRHFGFHYYESWKEFYAFATQEEQRYFEVSAGKGSIKDQILSCRLDYANLVLPVMQQHQVVFLDQSLTPEDKLEKLVELTKQMAEIKSGSTKHRDIEEHLREELHLPENEKLQTEWRKLYDLEQTFIREVDEGEYNGNGTYWNQFLVKYYNTDSTEMLPILEQELLRKEHL